MTIRRGGNITLRLMELAPSGRVEYTGTAAEEDVACPVRATVALADGAVVVETEGEAPLPEWLVSIIRTTLRAAWRAYRAGTPWPRRMSRWRPEPSDGMDRGDGER